MKAPNLSIIIPVYNVEPYLRECLDSIAMSSSDCWEAILIDDGSPDCCPQICDEYAARDNRFRVVHKGNGGVSSARNAGLDIARGEWIWFVDSDDIVDMQKVDDMLLWLKEHKDVDLVMFDLKNFNDGSVISKSTNENSLIVTDGELSKNDFLLKHICYHHQRLWYNKNIINKNEQSIRYSCGMKTGEDGEFQYKYLMSCHHPVRVYYTIYYYRIRSGSASNSVGSRAQVVTDTLQVFENLLCYMVLHSVQLESWLTMRLQGTMKILLYSIYKSNQQHRKELQHAVQNIFHLYKEAGYDAFRGMLFVIAYYSIPLYSVLLKINMRIKKNK